MTLYDSILLKGEKRGEIRGEKRGQQKTLLIVRKLKNGEQPKAIAAELDVDINFVLTIKDELGR